MLSVVEQDDEDRDEVEDDNEDDGDDDIEENDSVLSSDLEEGESGSVCRLFCWLMLLLLLITLSLIFFVLLKQ